MLEQAHRYASYREWHLPKITEVRLLQGKLEGAARSMYSLSLDDEKTRATLPQVLVSLEEQHAEAAVQLLTEWSDQEGDTGMSLGLAKNCAQLALDRNNAPAALLARSDTCLSRQGLADLARSYYEQALAIAPKNSEARLGLTKLR